MRWFLLAAGALTCVLMVDDFFLLHEEVFPKLLGVAQEITLASYALLMAMFLVYFKKEILSTDFILLLASFAFFACSILVDVGLLDAFELDRDINSLLEDGSKLLGIASWLAYFVHVCLLQLGPARAFRQPEPV